MFPFGEFCSWHVKLINREEGMQMVEKPDVYICNKCDHRFQDPKFVTEKDEEGFYITVPSCPKCGSLDLALSSMALSD